MKDGNGKTKATPDTAPSTDADTEELDIRDTDILFECPSCGKSMVIDYRGAGLSIPCVDCGQPVDVPIPEGMDVTDLDTSPADQGVRVIQMRELLADAQQKNLSQDSVIERLRADLAEARQRAEDAEARLQEIQWETEIIRRSSEKITNILKRLRETAPTSDSEQHR